MTDSKKTNSTPIVDEIATTAKDIDIFAGWINRLENPDPVLRTEAGGKGLKLYDEVDRDAHAGSVLQTRYLAVAGRQWEVLPADDSAQAQKIADFVKDAVDDCNFSRAIQEIMQAVLYGYYPAEVMWRSKGGKWVPDKLVEKHPRRFVFDHDRNPRLLTPENMIEGELLPDRKFVIFTWGSSDNPYGKGLGQKLWWPVWFKKHGIKWWLVFLEKFGMPTPVGKYPPGTDPKQQAALLAAIDAIYTETGVKIPDTMVIELLEATRGGKASYENLCDYMDYQISKAVLGQTLTTSGEDGGSYALGQVHDDVRQDIVKADADLFCETMNATLIRWIVDFNFSDVVNYPSLWIRTEDEQDLKELAERDKILLVDMGMGKRVPESYITETYGIPLAEKGEATLEISSSSSPTTQKEFAEAGRFTKEQQAIEDLVDSVVPGAIPHRNKITADILAAAEQATSWEELEALLSQMLKDQAGTGKLSKILAESMMAAGMWGRYAGR